METPSSARLRYRMFAESDLDEYAEMCADEDVMRYLGDGLPMSRADAWRNMAVVLGHWHLRGFGPWAVIESSTDRLVGRVGCWQPESWPGLEIGWTLRRGVWGKGYATEAGLVALNHAFFKLKQTRVISLIHRQNERSIAVALRLGMRREGVTEIFGHAVDVYGIRR
jgi:RimJ/RimL family protein N-acetyltransferase